MVDLKPCPFCGGEARLSIGRFAEVVCDECPASTFASGSEPAIAAWNTRAVDARIQALEADLKAAKALADDHFQNAERLAGRCTAAGDKVRALEAENARLRDVLRPFAKAAMGVETFAPDFPMDGAVMRASLDWYDCSQTGELARQSVRRRDLESARQALGDIA